MLTILLYKNQEDVNTNTTSFAVAVTESTLLHKAQRIQRSSELHHGELLEMSPAWQQEKAELAVRKSEVFKYAFGKRYQDGLSV